MRRLLALSILVIFAAGLGGPVGAQEDTTTSEPTTTTTTTTAPPPEEPTTTAPTTLVPDPTAPPPEESTTTTTAPADDPVAEEDAPPEEVPRTEETVPPPPGDPVDGAAATRLIRRELRVAQAEVMESDGDVRAAAVLVDDLGNRLAQLQSELARLDVAQELAVERLEAAQERFEERIANAVVRGNAAELDTVFNSADANEIETRKVFLRSVAEADSASVAELDAAKKVVDAGVLRAIDEVSTTRKELRAARKHFEELLTRNAEQRFQLAVFSAGSEIVIRGFVFPVGQPYTFGDSWGFPRMVGTEYEHGHQGVDIMAPFGTPLYATERGIISKMGTDVLGGTKLWLKGQSGTYYYYAHLQSFAEGISEGTLVDAGTIVGFVGDTGNAKGGAPHLHFQLHPGGGDPVNPYALLRVVSDLSRA